MSFVWNDVSLRTRRIGFVSLIVAGAIASGCSASDGDSESPPGSAPLGFGVTDEAALVGLLASFGMSDEEASCVANAAFAGEPLTTLFVDDASLDISQARLDDAGRVCEVEWSDYDFSTGD